MTRRAKATQRDVDTHTHTHIRKLSHTCTYKTLALIHGASLSTTWLAIKRQSAQMMIRCARTLTCPTLKRLFSPGGDFTHAIRFARASSMTCILKPLRLSSCCKGVLKRDPLMCCNGSRLTTDLESDYSRKGSTRGDETISEASVVRSEPHCLLLISETHLSISAPFHPLRVSSRARGGLFCRVFKKCLFR